MVRKTFKAIDTVTFVLDNVWGFLHWFTFMRKPIREEMAQFYKLNRPKSLTQGPTRADCVGHTATTRATEAQWQAWHWCARLVGALKGNFGAWLSDFDNQEMRLNNQLAYSKIASCNNMRMRLEYLWKQSSKKLGLQNTLQECDIIYLLRMPTLHRNFTLQILVCCYVNASKSYIVKL